MSNHGKPRIAWFTPPENAKEGESLSVAFSKAVIPTLKNQFEIEIFSSEGALDPLTAFQRHHENFYDLFFYQLEDISESNFIRIHCGLKPGIILFHDYVMKTDGPEPILNSPWQETVRSFHDSAYPFADRKAKFKPARPCAVRESAYAYRALFSGEKWGSDWKNAVKTVLNESNPLFLPHSVQETACASENKNRILFCGSPSVESRAFQVLHALKQLPEEMQCIWLIAESEKDRAREFLIETDSSQRVQLEIGRNPERWENLVAGGGIAIHTHFSAYGQAGLYLPISLMAGLPCLVTNFGHSEYLPDDVVWKIQPGETETGEIAGAVQQYHSGAFPLDSKYIQKFAQGTYGTAKVASELAMIFQKTVPGYREFLQKWENFEKRAEQSLLAEIEAGVLSNPMSGANDAAFQDIICDTFSMKVN